MIGIVHYGLGNIKAIEKALDRLGIPHQLLVGRESDFDGCTHFILPGVGHFGTGMKNLESSGLADLIKLHVSEKKKPVLGICLGMQLFAGHSEEGDCAGLGLINGIVKRLDPPEPGAKIPLVGWNRLFVQRISRLLKGIDGDDRFYFVHSYGFPTGNSEIQVAIARYFGSEICAVVEQNNLVGVQFHPEKSHDQGMKILKNFYEGYG